MDQTYIPPYLFQGQPYLARSFDEITRQRCFLYHESLFLNAMKAELIPGFTARGLYVFERREQDALSSIILKWTPIHRGEGELELEYHFNNAPLYVLGISVIPGSAVGLPEPETLLIGRMQGYKRRYDLFKDATKRLGDVAPQAALISAAEGVARALGHAHMVGVAAVNCCGFKHEHRLAKLETIYDEFFTALGAESDHVGFFRLSVPLPRKSAQAAKPGHRIRTRRKQEIKQQISDEVREKFRAALEDRFVSERDWISSKLGASGRPAEEAVEAPGVAAGEAAAPDARNEAAADLDVGAPRGLAARWLASRFRVLRRLAESWEADRLRRSGFDAGYYLAHNRDVSGDARRAALHYVRHGRLERRPARFLSGSSPSRFHGAVETRS